MDYDGPARLKWMANSSFGFSGAVDVHVVALPSGWRVRAHPRTAEDFEVLFLGSPYLLEFPDGSEFAVGLTHPDAQGVVEAWDWEQEAEERLTCRQCRQLWPTVQVTWESDDTISVTTTCPTCRDVQTASFAWSGSPA